VARVVQAPSMSAVFVTERRLTGSALKLHFRPMRINDIDLVAAIEAEVYDFPWGPQLLADCLTAHYACWVVEHRTEAVGYGILTVAAGEAHILNLGVPRRWWGRGIGTRLVKRLTDIARWYHAQSIYLEVRPSNEQAIKIYQREGFSEVGRRKGYYPARNGREDAVVMRRDLL
jgi:[ribosomal protein S18]-alanine N-acetyltransferase